MQNSYVNMFHLIGNKSVLLQDENETEEVRNAEQKNKNGKKKSQSLEELYKKKHEEQEKARLEREAIIQAAKEKREKTDAKRKSLKEKMYKKTRSGQPVMKYRIEHMLETIEKLNKVVVLSLFLFIL